MDDVEDADVSPFELGAVVGLFPPPDEDVSWHACGSWSAGMDWE